MWQIIVQNLPNLNICCSKRTIFLKIIIHEQSRMKRINKRTFERELLEQSSKTKITASKLLVEKNIIKALSKVGEPLLIGSYELDLMLDKDIDIIVKTNTPKVSAIEAINSFIAAEVAQKYEFGDFVRYSRDNRPNGYIVNLLITEFEDIEWEIEIWFFREISYYLNQLKDYKDKINPQKRLEILKRKHLRNYSGKTKYEISSVDIYKEVLKTVWI